MGMFYKRRDYTKIVNGRNPIVAHEFLGSSVEGKDVLIIDDMISSGESMLDVAKELKRRKARKVFICATFGLFTGGLAKFVGPTGGFLISFPLMAFVIGWGVEHRKAFPGAFVVALVAGTVLNYVVGVAMFCALTQSTLAAGITACVLPFIPTAIIKAILASVVGFAVRKRLN